MLKNDETSGQRRDVAHDVLPVLQNLGGRGGSRVDIVV